MAPPPAWPDGKFNVSMLSGPRIGTIIDGGSYGAMQASVTLKYKRIDKMGLIKTGNTSFQVVPVYVRGSARYETKYEKTIYIPDGSSGKCKLYGSDAKYIYWRGNFNLGPYGTNRRDEYRTASGAKLSSTDKLACYRDTSASYLYKVIQAATVTYNSTTYYYKVREGKFAALQTYEVKTSAAAGAWVAQNRNDKPTVASGSSTAVYTVALDRLDRLSANLGNLRTEMQAILNQDAGYRSARDHATRFGSVNVNQDISGTVEKVLLARGYNAADIAWFINPTNTPSGFTSAVTAGGGTGGTNGSRTGGVPTTGNGNPTGQRPTPDVAPTPAVTKVVVRAPYGYSTPPDKAPDTRPQIVQNYVDYIKDSSTKSGYKERAGQEIFHFPYVPNNVSYSGLGSEWTNIDRQGNYPLVEWAKWQLMRVELEFLLAEDRLVSGGTKVPDGIFVSVQNRLNVLRRMAQRQAPVSIFNLDDLFRVQVRRAAKTGKPMQFVIADMSVQSSRRAMDSIEKEITAATVRLTLQEIPIENVTVVKMTPPQLTDPIIPRKENREEETPSDPLWWSGVQQKL